MPTPCHRAYAGADDRDAALDLWLAARAAGVGDPWPPLDSLLAELDGLPPGSPRAAVWPDRAGRPAAMALLLDESVLVWCARVGADDEALDGAVVAWGLEAARRAAGRDAPALFVPVRDDDWRLAELLARAGFQEDGWRTLRMGRSLREPVAPPQDPPGALVRPLSGAGDLAGAAALHGRVFPFGQQSARERAALTAAPGYRPAMDLVACADGVVVGFALGVCCAAEGRRLPRAAGWVEFVGVAQAWRRRGLGRALTLHLLRAMGAEGLDAALLTTSAGNAAARRLFAECGFHIRHVVRWYVRELGLP